MSRTPLGSSWAVYEKSAHVHTTYALHLKKHIQQLASCPKVFERWSKWRRHSCPRAASFRFNGKNTLLNELTCFSCLPRDRVSSCASRSGIFVEIICLVGRLSLNSLIVCAITVREEPKLHVSPTSETSQTWLWDVVWKPFDIETLWFTELLEGIGQNGLICEHQKYLRMNAGIWKSRWSCRSVSDMFVSSSEVLRLFF